MPRTRGPRRPYRRRPGMGVRRRLAFGKMRLARRLVNPTPTFTETFRAADVVTNIPGFPNGQVGGVFKYRISDIPQIADYQQLYRQYRINWIKVMLLPEVAATVTDVNTLFQNNAAAIAVAGQARIVYVINDTPAVPNPANENDVLTDNGCKIRSLVNKWSCSFRPVTDKYTSDAAGGAGVATREKYRGFLSFAAQAGNNPEHGGVSYWISHYAPNAVNCSWKCYVKINFTLRDPE